MRYLSVIAIILSLASLGYSYQIGREGNKLGASILSTASSDTLETFRTNVNTSLTTLLTNQSSTTGAFTWTALQNFVSASSTAISANSAEFGGTATTTFTSTGFVGIASTSPWAKLSINPVVGDGTAPSFAIGSSTATRFVVTNAGRVGIGTSTPSANLSVGTGGATSTTMGGNFCAFFQDEKGRGMWIKLAIAGNVVFSTSTSPCNI